MKTGITIVRLLQNSVAAEVTRLKPHDFLRIWSLLMSAAAVLKEALMTKIKIGTLRATLGAFRKITGPFVPSGRRPVRFHP